MLLKQMDINTYFFTKEAEIAMKEIRNGEPVYRNTTNSGICKRSGKKAEVTSFFIGSVECRTDLGKTYRFKGYKCSLNEKSGHINPACLNECPLIQKELI